MTGLVLRRLHSVPIFFGGARERRRSSSSEGRGKMKNYVKTLEGSQFEVEVDAEDTVADVKKHIETVQGADVYPSVQQMLIHQGKVLKDSTKLSENNVIENSFLVIMLSKPKASSGPSTTTAAPTSQVESPNPPPANPTPQVTSASSVSPIVSSPPAPVSSAPATPTSLVTGSSEQDVYGEAASNLVSGSSLEETIQNILDIGGGTWDRDTVVRALRAAFNNPERAIEYLYSGIPEPAEVPIVERPPPNVQAGNPPAAQAPPTTVTSSGPNANPLDLFPQGLPSSGQNPGAGTLDFLRNSPQFQALRAMVQANPQILQPMLQELGRQNPQLMRLIQEHQPDFLSLINEPVEGGAEGNLFGDAAAMPQAITVTPEEREAIERILMVLCIGGAERLIVDAAVELASHGHAVHIFTAHHDRTRCFEETIGGPFPVTIYGGFLPRHIFYRFHADFAYLRCIFVALCVLLLWPSFDIVVADQVSVIIPLVKLKKSTKVVFYCHFPDLLLAQRSNALRRLYRKPIDMIEEATTGMADLVVVNSRFTASTFAKTFRHLNARGIQPDVLYPAVAIEQFEEPSAYKLNFLSANRFERKKNIGLAISAFSLLQKDGLLGDMVAGVTLTLAGGFDKRLKENVEYLEELKALAEQEGVSNRVAFTTSCSTAERNQLLSECICVVYTPKDEHFGIVPLEAMAAQKPVIACNSSGPLETINHGVTGFLCKPTSHDFSQALAKLIRNPELAERMGREAREHVCRYFSTKVFGQRLNSIVLDVCHRRQE